MVNHEVWLYTFLQKFKGIPDPETRQDILDVFSFLYTFNGPALNLLVPMLQHYADMDNIRPGRTNPSHEGYVDFSIIGPNRVRIVIDCPINLAVNVIPPGPIIYE